MPLAPQPSNPTCLPSVIPSTHMCLPHLHHTISLPWWCVQQSFHSAEKVKKTWKVLTLCPAGYCAGKWMEWIEPHAMSNCSSREKRMSHNHTSPAMRRGMSVSLLSNSTVADLLIPSDTINTDNNDRNVWWKELRLVFTICTLKQSLISLVFEVSNLESGLAWDSCQSNLS